MTVATAADSGNFDIGRVISRTFSVTGNNFLVFFALALLARVPLLALQLAQVANGPAQQGAAFNPGLVLTALASVLISLIMSFVLQAALVHGTIVSLNGRRASFVDCLGTGIRLFIPVLGITLLVGFGAMLGFLLFVVPGIMLLIRWIVAVPVRVAEGPGILKAMGRSAELTHGHRWAIFGAALVFVLIAIGLAMLLIPFAAATRVATAAQAPSSALVLANVGVSNLVSAISSMIGAVFAASVYFELRTIKEGIGPEQLAAVFS
jgi:hypothetical protein